MKSEHKCTILLIGKVMKTNRRWYQIKLGNIFESLTQLKFCVTNYVVSHGYRIYFEKCDTKRIVARCGKRKEESKCSFRLYVAWIYKEISFQIKAMNSDHKCSRQIKFGSIVSLKWIERHYVTEIANKSKMKLQELIDDIRQRYRCVVYIRQVRKKGNGSKFSLKVNPLSIMQGYEIIPKNC
uniref:Transposase MuDR plant domain-containing protein n=1 Tax=Lactuca sativa TaxID=4236 RepID=A0A9R1WL91_LACSA|nr:hypothetical protein LSAT_V11C100028960 [Lactuca sativa]